MSELKYGFSKKLEHTSFDQVVGQVTEALKAEGFGILSEIDVKATLKKKLDIDFRRYLILGACNPPLAHRSLETEPHIGLFLPCNVVVQEEKNGTIVVSIADPKVMFTLVDNPAIQPIAEEAEQRLRRAMDRLG